MDMFLATPQRSLNVAPTLWPSALELTQEAQYLGIMQQRLSSSEGDSVDWDVSPIHRYGPRRSSIQLLANNLRLHPLVGVVTLVLLSAGLTG